MSHGLFDGRSAGEVVSDVASGLVAGCIAGAFASWMMTTMENKPQQKSRPNNQEGGDRHSPRRRESKPEKQQQQEGGDEPTVMTAQAVSREVFGHELEENEKQVAGPAVHYTYGAAVGGLYGALAEVVPTVSIGGGIAYGAVLWLLGDEIAVPALGLGKSPTQIPATEHADKLAQHFCYGMTLDITRRILRIFI